MKEKMAKCGFVAGLISVVMLLNVAGAPPKANDANRETQRIMKQIKIPPPYTPVYQPPTGPQYVPSARVTPDYSPKIMPAQLPAVPKPTTVELSAPPLTATNATSAMATNVPIVDKAVKTSNWEMR